MNGVYTYEEYRSEFVTEKDLQAYEDMKNEFAVIGYFYEHGYNSTKKGFLEVLEKFADTITYAEAKDIADTFGYVLFSKAKLDKKLKYSDVLAYLKENNINIRLRNKR